MRHDYEPDAFLLSLARLPPASPTLAGSQRIRARCHAALVRRQAARRRAIEWRIALARLADAALTAMLCGYAAVALAEAFRLFQ